MKYILPLFFVAVAIQGSSQINSQTNNKRLIDATIGATVLIQYNNGASGSGVFMVDTNASYLVTAKHVIFRLDQNGNPISLVDNYGYLILYRENTVSGSKDSLVFNLIDALHNNLIRCDSVQDIAIVKIGTVVKNLGTSFKDFKPLVAYEPSVRQIRSANIAAPGIFYDISLGEDKINLGENVFMYGYPKSLKNNDYDFDRPLLRKGVIAGVDKRTSNIILDCPSYKGNSGGPVIYYTQHYEEVGIIGIVSRSILQIELLHNSYYDFDNYSAANSGYTVVVPIKFALRLMKSMPRSKLVP